MKKTLVITALTLTVIGTGALAATKTFAQTTTTTNPMSTLVQKIADKFGLSKTDVQAVFDQDRTDREVEMETKYEQQLAQYVSDGKITEAQKQLILAKHKELEASRQTERQSFEGMTDEQRQTAMEANRSKMEAERTALEQWATQNGIDVSYLMGLGKHGGRGFGMGPGPDSATAPASTQ